MCETSIPLPTQVPVLFNGCRSGEIFSIDLRQRGRRDNSRKANRFHQESAITSLHILRDENYLIAADMQGQVRASALNLRTSARKRPHILPSSSISRPFDDILLFFSCAQIKLWDVRATKSVQEYKGHHNEHAYLPVHVCEDEGLLLAGRKDGAKNVESIYALFPNPHFQSPPLFLLLSPAGQDCYTRLWSLKDGRLLRTIPSPHPAANDLIPSVVFSSKLGGRRGLPGLLMAVKHDLYYFPYNADYQDIEEKLQGF